MSDLTTQAPLRPDIAVKPHKHPTQPCEGDALACGKHEVVEPEHG